MTWIDWKRRRCYVEPAEGGGKARWLTPGVSGASFALSRAAREVLLGADPPVALTQRAKRILAEVRDEHLSAVHPAGTVITRAGEDVRWWTWAGLPRQRHPRRDLVPPDRQRPAVRRRQPPDAR